MQNIIVSPVDPLKAGGPLPHTLDHFATRFTVR